MAANPNTPGHRARQTTQERTASQIQAELRTVNQQLQQIGIRVKESNPYKEMEKARKALSTTTLKIEKHRAAQLERPCPPECPMEQLLGVKENEQAEKFNEKVLA
ncbi:hypothetical protein N7462_002604 [Penicillium macrosclerotiorum]|uniref:uncharacterized protein n=1 Tax=Penicillium macrosclerotiorum TaxID=303699 RepID=UPI002546A969|nr:uncharacterized protein N7462_002604 [Penicillium macrosclerotiorum]KAJ5693181.1 hypothetical protein N7462_002604 [Penicillium macrosclerotiorum]